MLTARLTIGELCETYSLSPDQPNVYTNISPVFVQILPVEEWSQSTTIARAFSIGAKEAEAVSNLMCKVPATVVETLCAAVRVRGMARFLSHEAIAKSVFNTGWSSGMVACEARKDQLTNKEDCRLVPRL